MSIQWFPGHMNAAKKKAAEQMADVDVVIEVVTRACLRPAATHWWRNCANSASVLA